MCIDLLTKLFNSCLKFQIYIIIIIGRHSAIGRTEPHIVIYQLILLSALRYKTNK